MQNRSLLCCPTIGHSITWIYIHLMRSDENEVPVHQTAFLVNFYQTTLLQIHTHKTHIFSLSHTHTHLPHGWWRQTLIRGHQTCHFSPRFSIHHSPFLTPSAGFWRKMIFKRNQKSTESVPRIFSLLLVWIVAHFSVMGNKMWFQACLRTWMIPVQDLEAWVSRPTFLSLLSDMNH